MSLDLTKLVNLRSNGTGWVAQCPQCALEGRDQTNKNHLSILPDHRFNCIVDSSSTHRSQIFALVGVGADSDLPIQKSEPTLALPKTWPLSILDKLIKDYSYWEKRGISAKTLEPFRGGVATDGQLASRFVFPIFDQDETKIIGFSARCIKSMSNEERKKFGRPKWKILNSASKFLWGGLDEITDRVVLVESIGDGASLREHGIPENLCMFGLNMSETILAFLITRNPSSIIISTNRDPNGAGQKGAAQIQRTLLKFFDPETIKIIHPPVGVKDWGEATEEQIRETFKVE